MDAVLPWLLRNPPKIWLMMVVSLLNLSSLAKQNQHERWKKALVNILIYYDPYRWITTAKSTHSIMLLNTLVTHPTGETCLWNKFEASLRYQTAVKMSKLEIERKGKLRHLLCIAIEAGSLQAIHHVAQELVRIFLSAKFEVFGYNWKKIQKQRSQPAFKKTKWKTHKAHRFVLSKWKALIF